MNTSTTSLSELWKGYSKILYFLGQTDKDPNIALTIVIFLGSILLIVGLIAFFIWKFFKFLSSRKFSDRTESQGFPGTPAPRPLPTLLYERAGMGPWCESEDFQVEEDEEEDEDEDEEEDKDEDEEEDEAEIQRATGPLMINGSFSPEYFSSTQSNITPPPPYKEVDSMFEDIPHF